MSVISKQSFLDAVAIQIMAQMVTAFGESADGVDAEVLGRYSKKAYEAAEALWAERERRRSADEQG